MGLEFIVTRRLTVLMQIDKTWGYDHPRRVNRSLPGEWVGCHGADLAVLDGNVPDRVQPGLGIHHPPVQDDQVNLFGRFLTAWRPA